jgi:hypothetical protein
MTARAAAERLVPLLDETCQVLIVATVASGGQSNAYEEALAPAYIALNTALMALGREFPDLDKAVGSPPTEYPGVARPPLPMGKEPLRQALSRAEAILNSAMELAVAAGDSVDHDSLRGEIDQALSAVKCALTLASE